MVKDFFYTVSDEELHSFEREWITKGMLNFFSSKSGEKNVFSNQVVLIKNLLSIGHQLNLDFNVYLFPKNDEIRLGPCIIYGLSKYSQNPEINIFKSILPVLIKRYSSGKNDDDFKCVFFGDIEVWVNDSELFSKINTCISNIVDSKKSKISQFSRSASYMGSKSSVAAFLSEIVEHHNENLSTVVDLMCGSGAVANAFSKKWKTIASDAQDFSRILAVVQGGGMNLNKAITMDKAILQNAKEHYRKLSLLMASQLEKEEDFLFSEITTEKSGAFLDWIKKYPRVGISDYLTPEFLNKVNERKIKNDLEPYMLFTTYYANLFFGVRQAVEIDSLRFAIDQLVDETEKKWALGALICAVSFCAYSYGGHFAQPKIKNVSKKDINKVASEIIYKRALSVSHEFTVRLQNLACESEEIKNHVTPQKGPWQLALSDLEVTLKGEQVCVYIDPPYTRDEYSRYYHVLETLIKYNYPEVIDAPSIPKRGSENRFASDFFTRNITSVNSLISSIISICLEKGWTCVWSYSNSGVADIEEIIKEISDFSESISIYTFDHKYSAQGKARAKKVLEYVFVIHPLKIN